LRPKQLIISEQTRSIRPALASRIKEILSVSKSAMNKPSPKNFVTKEDRVLMRGNLAYLTIQISTKAFAADVCYIRNDAAEMLGCLSDYKYLDQTILAVFSTLYREVYKMYVGGEGRWFKVNEDLHV
jgi:hypothetical protein